MKKTIKQLIKRSKRPTTSDTKRGGSALQTKEGTSIYPSKIGKDAELLPQYTAGESLKLNQKRLNISTI